MSTTTTVEAKTAPGVADTIPYRVTSVSKSGGSVVAIRLDYQAAQPEVFTRRKNGHYALRGNDQWHTYLRGPKVAEALMRGGLR